MLIYKCDHILLAEVLGLCFTSHSSILKWHDLLLRAQTIHILCGSIQRSC